MRVIHELRSVPRSLAFSPDGRFLASAGTTGHVWLWDALTGGPGSGFATASVGVEMSVTFAPDSRHFVVATLGHSTVWDPLETRRIKQLPGSDAAARAGVGFLPDGTLVLGWMGEEAGVSLYEPMRWQEVGRWEPPEVSAGWNLLAIEPGGTRAATGNGYLLDAWTGKVLGRWSEAPGGSALAWCPQKSLIACRIRDSTIELRDGTTGETTATLSLTRRVRYEAFGFTPDGRRVITARSDGAVWVYDPNGASLGVPGVQ